MPDDTVYYRIFVDDLRHLFYQASATIVLGRVPSILFQHSMRVPDREVETERERYREREGEI